MPFFLGSNSDNVLVLVGELILDLVVALLDDSCSPAVLESENNVVSFSLVSILGNVILLGLVVLPLEVLEEFLDVVCLDIVVVFCDIELLFKLVFTLCDLLVLSGIDLVVTLCDLELWLETFLDLVVVLRDLELDLVFVLDDCGITFWSFF